MPALTTQTCRHHWLLGDPQEGVVPGICKLCGSHRDYPARLEDTDRFFDHQELLHPGHPVATIYQAPPEEQAN